MPTEIKRARVPKTPFSPSVEENRNTCLKKRSAESASDKNPKKQKKLKPAPSNSLLTIDKENNENYAPTPWDPSNDNDFEFDGFIDSDDDSSSLIAKEPHSHDINSTPSRALLAGLFGKSEEDILSSSTITSVALKTIFEDDEAPQVNHHAAP